METDYLNFFEAIQFVNECEKKVLVYGIERFICKNGKNMPDLNNISDFSYIDEIEKTFSASRNFLSLFGKNKNERFKIVYE